jgi:hypothetical protein
MADTGDVTPPVDPSLAGDFCSAVVNVSGDLAPTCTETSGVVRVSALSAFVCYVLYDWDETRQMYLVRRLP